MSKHLKYFLNPVGHLKKLEAETECKVLFPLVKFETSYAVLYLLIGIF